MAAAGRTAPARIPRVSALRLLASRSTAVAALFTGAALLLTTAAAPATAPPPAPTVQKAAQSRPPLPAYHVVRPGDTISSIAKRYRMSWETLARRNQLSAPYRVYVDGVLRLTPPPQPLAPYTTRIERVRADDPDGTWRPGCPVTPEKLRRVWVAYVDYRGVSRQGSLVVFHTLAPKVQQVFRKLYEARFRIEAMEPLAVNAPHITDHVRVTMSYNCRAKIGGGGHSEHSYGNAVDINPPRNPYVSRSGSVVPVTSRHLVSRTPYRMGMIHREGVVVDAFRRAGFRWGGFWSSSKDYMHFSVNGR